MGQVIGILHPLHCHAISFVCVHVCLTFARFAMLSPGKSYLSGRKLIKREKNKKFLIL
jgi:hypothetical protein